MSTQLIDDIYSPKDRLGASGELNDSIFALGENSSVLIVDLDHRAWASLVERGRNESHRQKSSLVATGGGGDLKLRHCAQLLTEIERCEARWKFGGGAFVSRSPPGRTFLRGRSASRQKTIASFTCSPNDHQSCRPTAPHCPQWHGAFSHHTVRYLEGHQSLLFSRPSSRSEAPRTMRRARGRASPSRTGEGLENSGKRT